MNRFETNMMYAQKKKRLEVFEKRKSRAISFLRRVNRILTKK